MAAGAGYPFLIYGSNTLFFFLYTWPFFLALMPVAVVVGIALHSLQWQTPVQRRGDDCDRGLMFGLLFFWLMG
jgi:hypothetical protein